jgi:hypothetical protein
MHALKLVKPQNLQNADYLEKIKDVTSSTLRFFSENELWRKVSSCIEIKFLLLLKNF